MLVFTESACWLDLQTNLVASFFERKSGLTKQPKNRLRQSEQQSTTFFIIHPQCFRSLSHNSQFLQPSVRGVFLLLFVLSRLSKVCDNLFSCIPLMEMAAEVVKHRIGVCANGTTEWQLISCHVIEENPCYCFFFFFSKCVIVLFPNIGVIFCCSDFFGLINLRRCGGRSLLRCCCLYIPGPVHFWCWCEAMGPNWTGSKRCFFVLRLWVSVKKCFIYFTQPPEKNFFLMKCHPKPHHKKKHILQRKKKFLFLCWNFFGPPFNILQPAAAKHRQCNRQ